MSQLESQTKAIAGRQFEVFKLPPLDANDVLIEIVEVVGPALGKLADASTKAKKTSILDLELDEIEVGDAIEFVAKSLTKERLRSLIGTMSKVSHCDGKRLADVFDIVFRGDLAAMYQWLFFAIEVNFGNFFDFLRSAIGRGRAAVSQADQFQTTSEDTGRSSESRQRATPQDIRKSRGSGISTKSRHAMS